MFQEDYILRQIQSMAQALAKIMFRKDTTRYELPAESERSAADFLYLRLKKLIGEGELNQAENLLFDQLDTSDLRYLELAVDFYSELNRFDNRYLDAHDFSRSEIQQGLQEISEMYHTVI